jgi:hypothetical protein
MRLKVLSLFLATQITLFGIWSYLQPAPQVRAHSSAEQKQEVVAGSKKPKIPTAVQLKTDFLRFAARNLTKENSKLAAITEDQVREMLAKFPKEHAKSVKTIVLDYNPEAHRGLGGSKKIILRATDIEAAEAMAVLTHELAHNVDLVYFGYKNTKKPSGFMDGKTVIYESDPSLNFYRISWQNEKTKKSGSSKTDFVSGYAMTDPFEDFAETYAYYVLQNESFKSLAASNTAMNKKYIFMRDTVFGGRAFPTGSSKIQKTTRPWDVTVLAYDLNKFLGSI